MMLEFRRKAFHTGSSLLLLLAWYVLRYEFFLLLLACLLLLGASFLLFRPRLVERALDLFERAEVRRVFPGKGAFMMVGGVLLCALLFPMAVPAALLIIGVSDSLATIFGVRYGKRSLPWTGNKTFLGTGVFALSSSLILFFFTPYWAVGVLLLSFFESLDYNDLLLLDDNLVLPLVTGAFIVVASAL